MLLLHNVNGYLAFDAAECKALGQSLADRYQHAESFPHIVMDRRHHFVNDWIPPKLQRLAHRLFG